MAMVGTDRVAAATPHEHAACSCFRGNMDRLLRRVANLERERELLKEHNAYAGAYYQIACAALRLVRMQRKCAEFQSDSAWMDKLISAVERFERLQDNGQH